MAWSLESTSVKRCAPIACIVTKDSTKHSYTSNVSFSHISLPQEDDYVDLAAKHLYIQHGSDSRPENVKDVVQDCISNSLLETKTESNWVQMVSTAYAQVSRILDHML